MRSVVLALLLAACSSNPESAEPQPAPAPTEAEPAAATNDATAATPEAPETAEQPATASADDKKQVAGEMVTMLEDVALAMKTHEQDCVAMAGAIDGIATKYANLIVKIQELSKDENRDPEFEKWFNETYGERLKKTMTEAMGAMQTKCAADEGVKNAFERLFPS